MDRRYALTKAQVAKAMEMYNSGKPGIGAALQSISK